MLYMFVYGVRRLLTVHLLTMYMQPLGATHVLGKTPSMLDFRKYKCKGVAKVN